MAQKKTVWLTDGYGNTALVEGVEERDRWMPLGWSEVDEPGPTDQVWMRHAEHGGRARFAAGAVEMWQQMGWHPTSPPEPDSPFNAPAPADVVEPAPVSTSTTKTSSESKEKQRG